MDTNKLKNIIDDNYYNKLFSSYFETNGIGLESSVYPPVYQDMVMTVGIEDKCEVVPHIVDINPVTTLGRILASAIAVLGVGMVALPAGILASGFMEEIGKKRIKKMKCPHCGENIDIEG